MIFRKWQQNFENWMKNVITCICLFWRRYSARIFEGSGQGRQGQGHQPKNKDRRVYMKQRSTILEMT